MFIRNLRDEDKETNYCRNPDRDPLGPWCVKAGTAKYGKISITQNEKQKTLIKGLIHGHLSHVWVFWGNLTKHLDRSSNKKKRPKTSKKLSITDQQTD